MIIANTTEEVRRVVGSARSAKRIIGLVPTMGALHEGHLSLVKLARKKADLVVMSLFVNPTQFNSKDDLERYPRVLDDDCRLAESAGVDLLFCPPVEEIYPDGPASCSLKAGSMSAGLCGGSRPGHFDGVVTVVSILFNIVEPDLAVFGEKDYQQLKVIEQMVRDLKFAVEIVPGPLIREPDGLAMSSRNRLLSPPERTHALAISKTLFQARDLARAGERSGTAIRSMVERGLRLNDLLVDYVELREADSLEPVSEIDKDCMLLVAAFCGKVRLIDNVRLLLTA